MAATPSHPLPRPTDAGVLPEGIHDATLQEIRERFGRFQSSSRRIGLVDKLDRYLEELRKTGWNVAVIVDGSFVMECVDAPSDIDLVLILPADWDMSAELKPFEYNLVSRKRTRRGYRIDVFAVRSGSEEERQWLEYFQELNPKWNDQLKIPLGIKKGLAKIIT